MEKTATKFVGLGTLGVLGVAFGILKPCGVISWSRWAVLAPFWMPLAFIVALILATLVAAAIRKA